MRRRLSLSFTNQVILGVVLGILAGLFFGEEIAGIEILGTAYVHLLQMTILPYIMVSLIQGFGCLTKEQAIKVAPRLAMVMAVFWTLGLTLVAVLPMTFPDRESASFFNPSILENVPKPALVDLFIPANPFESLAMGTIPAVVLFSILFGSALMGVDHKDGLLRSLGLITQTLTRVTMMIVKITPLGVFAMSASAAGTMDVAEFARLQVYFTTYITACLFLTFFVFPQLVSSCTPLGTRKLLKTFKPVLVMAFTTGNLFVVLPLLMERTRLMFEEEASLQAGEEYVDILAPVAFNFPNMGKLIALLFVLFGAWFVGAPIPASDYPSFLSTGWVTFFGGIDMALPFMLSIEGLPADLFNIYSVSGVINGRFATLLAGMELICITLITGSWLSGSPEFRPRLKKVLPRAATILVTGAGMIWFVSAYLERVVPSTQTHLENLKSRDIETRPPMIVAAPGDPLPPPTNEGFHLFKKSTEDSRNLRVGYIPNSIPFAYTNQNGNLVGYDIDLLCRMAADMNLSLEFHPTTYLRMEKDLQELRLDIVASGISLNSKQIRSLSFSEPYEQVILGMVMPTEQKESFQKMVEEQTLKASELTFAVVDPNPYLDTFRAVLPNATFDLISSPKTYFDAPPETYTGLLTSMEAGSIWSMLNPGFSTLLLHEGTFRVDMVLAAGPNNSDMIRYVDDWLRLQKSKGTMDNLYEYWVRGQPRPNETVEPRWSIKKDVLGW